ncbi:hypothetical protein ALP75_202167 [Pseudomonas syringae pv. actinidiae]|nr:hypothetical protein ALP75_202167 [Pseudomonas syringae pv. actinidiae]
MNMPQLPLVDQRAQRSFSARRIADRQRPGLVCQLAGERSNDGLMNQNQAGGHADLPLMQPGAEGRVAGGEIKVGVFKNHQRVLAAQLQRNLLEVAPGRFGHLASGTGRTGKGDHLHIGVAAQRFASICRTWQYMQQAFGQPGFLEQPSDQKAAADRRLRVRLEHHGIAGSQRRGDRAQGQHQRKVER